MMVVFSATQAAAALWTYGEDALVEKALALTELDLRRMWHIAGSRWTTNHGLPLKSRLVLDKVTAFACIEYLEKQLRPLAQERRRPRSQMPAPLQNAQPVPIAWSMRALRSYSE